MTTSRSPLHAWRTDRSAFGIASEGPEGPTEPSRLAPRRGANGQILKELNGDADFDQIKIALACLQNAD